MRREKKRENVKENQTKDATSIEGRSEKKKKGTKNPMIVEYYFQGIPNIFGMERKEVNPETKHTRKYKCNKERERSVHPAKEKHEIHVRWFWSGMCLNYSYYMTTQNMCPVERANRAVIIHCTVVSPLSMHASHHRATSSHTAAPH